MREPIYNWDHYWILSESEIYYIFRKPSQLSSKLRSDLAEWKYLVVIAISTLCNIYKPKMLQSLA